MKFGLAPTTKSNFKFFSNVFTFYNNLNRDGAKDANGMFFPGWRLR